ncbi:Panacea domain-containing protein [Haemophilus paraphrohaemolyticus]|uniref:Panacea domain-containing protein n=1 Tax=Haemophilus paraphrohaemolyticus TaxID=736 RepID=UPI000E01B8A7|nr:Uncharacterised protein [Haemophilus paraphrohaemolyticus]
MPYGPVLSKTLNLIHGETLPQLSGNATVWDNWIKDDANYCVSLAKEIDENDEYFWGCLSLNDEQILNRVFADFGHFKTFELVEYTHNKRHVPEWQDPKGSSKKIKLPDLLAHLGKSKAHIAEILQEHKEQEEIDRLFAGALVCEKSRYCYLLSQGIMTTSSIYFFYLLIRVLMGN